MKIKAKIISNKLSNFPRMSVGFVSILDKEPESSFKNPLIPVTIKSAKKEKY